MSTFNSIIAIYKEIIKETNDKLSSVQNKIYRISTVRLILFIAGIAGVIYFFSSGWLLIVGVILITFVPFLFLVKYHNKLFNQRDYIEKKREINQQELNALNYDISSFDGGIEYIDSSHLYTYDLDVFGNKSLFQYINRTSTSFGKKTLANWFINHLGDKEKIEERQSVVTELAPQLKLRQRFRILGLIYKGEITDGDEIAKWATEQSSFRGKTIYKTLLILVPLINSILLLLGILGIISFNWFGFSFVFFVLANFMLQKGISQVQLSYTKKLKILSTYAGLMEIIEGLNAKSVLLKDIKKKIVDGEKSASKALKQLSAKMNALDQRNNLLVSLILNGLMFWELRQIIRIEAWKEVYSKDLLIWLDAVGEMDALCSLATLGYNHPEYAYPVISSQLFELDAKGMGHPLMDRNKCVKNDVNINKHPYFIIVTGANMAGKSTYLRTIGVNYLLACIGAPADCESMTVYPSQLITSLRTTDSLTENESYFFAELKRLKLIIDKLNAGEKLFIILDEILKGTNSMDKQKGSLALIKQFMTLDATGIIATHDLLLGSLVEKYPDNIRNYRFEADINNDELTFSYQLREGVAQNMNACFLMNKMGIAVLEEE